MFFQFSFPTLGRKRFFPSVLFFSTWIACTSEISFFFADGKLSYFLEIDCRRVREGRRGKAIMKVSLSPSLSGEMILMGRLRCLEFIITVGFLRNIITWLRAGKVVARIIPWNARPERKAIEDIGTGAKKISFLKLSLQEKKGRRNWKGSRRIRNTNSNHWFGTKGLGMLGMDHHPIASQLESRKRFVLFPESAKKSAEKSAHFPPFTIEGIRR